MKLTLHQPGRRRWPTHLFGGRVRTSTCALIVAFFVTAWLYNTYKPPPPEPTVPEITQVVPPGFVPDPEYTWVPRTSVRTYPRTTTPTTTTTTTTTTPPPTETTEPSEPPLPPISGETTTAPTTTPTPPPNPFMPTPPTPTTTPPAGPGPEPLPTLPIPAS